MDHQLTALDTAATTGLTALEVVRRWHDETHQWGFEQCPEQPCHAVARVRPAPEENSQVEEALAELEDLSAMVDQALVRVRSLTE